MLPQLPPILGRAGQHFPRVFALRQLRRRVERVCEQLGEERVDYLIRTGTSLSSLVPPEQARMYRAQAPTFAPLARLVSDEEFRKLLPRWTQDLIARHGERGERWLAELVVWVRNFFAKEEGHADAVQRPPAEG